MNSTLWKIIKYFFVGIYRAVFGYCLIKTAIMLFEIVTVPVPNGELTNGMLGTGIFGYATILWFTVILGGILKDR